MLTALALASNADLGTAAGLCRPNDGAPQVTIAVEGLKDRRGILRVELYPANDADFLADDDKLVQAGKTFSRVDMLLPASGPVDLCIRAPQPGHYALALLHDRNGNRRFDLTVDGVGFAGNPKLGWRRPRAAEASLNITAGRTAITVVVNYLRGFSMQPIQ